VVAVGRCRRAASRGYERAFLENVGPIALSAKHAAQNGGVGRAHAGACAGETVSEFLDRRSLVQKSRLVSPRA